MFDAAKAQIGAKLEDAGGFTVPIEYSDYFVLGLKDIMPWLSSLGEGRHSDLDNFVARIASLPVGGQPLKYKTIADLVDEYLLLVTRFVNGGRSFFRDRGHLSEMAHRGLPWHPVVFSWDRLSQGTFTRIRSSMLILAEITSEMRIADGQLMNPWRFCAHDMNHGEVYRTADQRFFGLSKYSRGEADLSDSIPYRILWQNRFFSALDGLLDPQLRKEVEAVSYYFFHEAGAAFSPWSVLEGVNELYHRTGFAGVHDIGFFESFMQEAIKDPRRRESALSWFESFWINSKERNPIQPPVRRISR